MDVPNLKETEPWEGYSHMVHISKATILFFIWMECGWVDHHH